MSSPAALATVAKIQATKLAVMNAKRAPIGKGGGGKTSGFTGSQAMPKPQRGPASGFTTPEQQPYKTWSYT